MFKFSKEQDEKMVEKLRSEFNSPDRRERRRKNVHRAFAITLILLILASVVNWGLISGWGKVDVERVYTTGSDGAEWSVLVYRPKGALDETPAPAIIMLHGAAGNARNHESWAVEFARRGFVVVSADLDGSGDALYTGASLHEQSEYWLKYMMNLPFVDCNHIITSGHSAGCTPASDLGAKYDVEGVILAGGVSFFNAHYNNLPGVFNPIKSKGNDRVDVTSKENMTATNAEWFTWDGKFCICMGYAEMMNYSTDGTWETFMASAGPALLNKYPGFEDVTAIEVNKVYGDFSSDSAFVFCAEDYRIHEGAFVSKNTIGNLLKYGQMIVGDAVPNYIDSNDQVWMYKDYAGLFGMFAFSAFLIALVMLLLEEVPVFNKLYWKPVRNVGFRGVGLLIDFLVALVAPYIIMKTDFFGLIGSQGKNLKSIGANLRYSNMSLGIVMALGLFALLGFVLFWLTERKKKSLTVDDLGLTGGNYETLTGSKDRVLFFGKTILTCLLLGCIVMATGYGFIKFQLEVAGTDFYAWFFGVKDIVISKLPAFAPFVLIYCLCYIPIVISMNVVRRLPSTGNETADIIINMLVNALLGSLVFIIIIAGKWHLQSMGQWATDKSWFWNTAMDVQRIFGIPAGISIAASSATFLYRKTNNVWLTAIVIGLIVSVMCACFGQYQINYLVAAVLK